MAQLQGTLDGTTRRRTAFTGAALVAVALLGGCLAGASTDPKTGPGDGGGSVALLHDARLARNSTEGGFDRFVLEFEDEVPPWRVAYVAKPVRADGSGAIVPLAGDHALEVRMSPAAGVDLGGGGTRITYTGPNRINTGTPEITEVVRTGDFEATLTWAIGTRHRREFRVTTLQDPPRLVVDVDHG
jgi:hypothetical protein